MYYSPPACHLHQLLVTRQHHLHVIDAAKQLPVSRAYQLEFDRASSLCAVIEGQDSLLHSTSQHGMTRQDKAVSMSVAHGCQAAQTNTQVF